MVINYHPQRFYTCLSVIPFTGGCLPDTPHWADTPLGQTPLDRHPPDRYPRTDTSREDTTPQANTPPADTTPCRRLLQQTVRILLECILVYASLICIFSKTCTVKPSQKFLITPKKTEFTELPVGCFTRNTCTNFCNGLS